LRNHIKHAHTETNRTFICDICSSIYQNKGSLKVHYDLVHTKKGFFPCPTCGKIFDVEHWLKEHLKKVHGPKNHACPYCSHRTTRKTLMNKHIFHTHTHSNLRAFKCELCNSAFKRKPDMESHIRTVHGPSDQFNCLWCTSSFKKKSNQVRHYRHFHALEYAAWRLENPPQIGRKRKFDDS
jgi:KRAB domain-containing zinc finger protein